MRLISSMDSADNMWLSKSESNELLSSLHRLTAVERLFVFNESLISDLSTACRHLFGTAAHKVQVPAFAVRAFRGHRLRVVAIVAEQLSVTAVVREGDRAVSALDPLSALAAHHEGREAAPVQQQDHLLPLLETLPDRIVESA